MKRTLPTLFFLVFIFSGDAFADKNATCQPPYQPTNILKLLLNYSATLEYITNAPEQCQKPFQRDITEVVRSTWLFTEGCKQVTFEDFEKAEKLRKEKSASPTPIPNIEKKGHSEYIFPRGLGLASRT